MAEAKAKQGSGDGPGATAGQLAEETRRQLRASMKRNLELAKKCDRFQTQVDKTEKERILEEAKEQAPPEPVACRRPPGGYGARPGADHDDDRSLDAILKAVQGDLEFMAGGAFRTSSKSLLYLATAEAPLALPTAG